MAIIPNDQQIHTVSENVDTTNRRSKQFNSNTESVTMADITATVINSGGGGGLAGAGTFGFIPRWTSQSSIGDSDIQKTVSYSAPNGGQYELRGNLKIFGESSGSGVAALFIEDSLGAKLQINDVDDQGNLNMGFNITAFDNFISIGTNTNSVAPTILINAQGQSKMALREESVSGVDRFCFVKNGGGAIGAPASAGPSYAWTEVFFNLDEYADDAAAGAGGIEAPGLYQTDGTGAAPLNVAGIVMVKQ